MVTKRIVPAVWGILSACLIASAQDGGGALQRKLDNPVRLTKRDTPLSLVFAALSAQSGVKFDVSPDTYRFLPYGQDTRLDVNLPGQSLRDTLTKMLPSEGLSWDVRDDVVRIAPTEPLYRIARRATFEEITRLGLLLTSKLKDTETKDIAETLAAATGEKNWKVILPPDWEEKQVRQLQEQFAKAPTGLSASWLDAGCGRELTWRLDGDRIVILSRKDQILRQLERRVSLEYKDAPLMTVLLDLAKLARVKLVPEPGVMNYLPPAVRNHFKFVMSDASIDQALKVITGSTGLEFPVSEEGIAVRRAADIPLGALEDRGTAPGAAPGVFIQTVIPTSAGRELRVFFVPMDMSPELQAAMESERERIMEELKKHYLTPDGQPKKDDAPPAFRQN
ncbi:MAG: hypothetical protein JXA11_02135 [Phycisphaerae bacterium]|nr:hypothetical protein [Phycisphaerae bacterium]